MSQAEPHEDLDLEDLAFRAACKPGLRLTLAPDEADAAERRYREIGAHALRAAHALRLEQGELIVLYVAWSRTGVEQMRDAEADCLRPSFIGPSEARHREGHRALGRLLGFPPCCVEHFVVSSGRWSQSGLGLAARIPMRFAELVGLRAAPVELLPPDDPRRLDLRALARLPRDAHDYVAARELLVPHPDARLNHLLFTARLRLLSFYPCAYDCAGALEIADATLGALERIRPGGARSLLARLARPVLVGACGGRVVVELDDDGTILAAQAPRPRDREARPVDLALEPRALGRRMNSSGFVPGVARAGEEPAILLDFRPARR